MEEAFFNDTNELEQIFTCAEENNLFVINRLQDAEENLEIELKKKRNLYEVKGRKEKDLKQREKEIMKEIKEGRESFGKMKK